jgi:hypothetical protein
MFAAMPIPLNNFFNTFTFCNTNITLLHVLSLGSSSVGVWSFPDIIKTKGQQLDIKLTKSNYIPCHTTFKQLLRHARAQMWSNYYASETLNKQGSSIAICECEQNNSSENKRNSTSQTCRSIVPTSLKNKCGIITYKLIVFVHVVTLSVHLNFKFCKYSLLFL